MEYYLAFYQKEWNFDTCYNMECWKYYTERMKPVIDSSKDEETTSKERSSLVVLDDSFPNKPQEHMIHICAFAKYKWLDDL